MNDEIHETLKDYFTREGFEVKFERKASKATTYRVNGFQNRLREVGIFGHNCYSKFIPKNYIYNTQEIRLNTLRGLFDSDGSCSIDPLSKTSRTKFISVSSQLCKDVKEIVHSLGGLCSMNRQTTTCNGKSFKSYSCEIRLPKDIIPFSLSRKRDNFTNRKIGDLKRTITKIEYLGQDNARCLTLEENDGLFMTDHFIVTHNCGKSIYGLNAGISIAERDTPILYLDTEMTKKDQQSRGGAMISYDTAGKSTINDIETGQFASNEVRKNELINLAKTKKTLPFYYKNIGGRAFEDQLSIMRRWIAKTVGLNDLGKAKDCVIIYDYLKLMEASELAKTDMKEFQLLGFMMTALHNFALRYEVPILCFIQLNRDGITKESTDAASGSDRIMWLCSNFAIYKEKSDEEIAKDGTEHGNRKLVPIIARHGEGLEAGDYINVLMQGKYAKLIEGATALELEAGGSYDDTGYDNEEEDVAF